MIGERKTINLRDQSGQTLDLTVKILELAPTLNNPSAIDKLAKAIGNGFTAGDIVKKSKRSQTKYTPANATDITSGFVGASAQSVSKVSIGKVYRQDNIIVSRVDLEKLKEGKGGEMVAMEIADFILVGKELDLKELLEEVTTQSKSMKIYTAIDATGAPTGAQPAQSATDVASAITAVKGGRRHVIATDLSVDNTLGLLRTGISYLNRLGAPKSAESLYPFSINGLPFNSIAVVTDYEHVSLIKDSFTRTVIDLSNPNTTLNFTGLVGYIDTVPVIMTNQLGVKEAFKVMSVRSMVRTLDPVTQFLGVVSNGNGQAVKLANDTVVNVKPSEAVIALEQGRAMGAKYFEEVISIDEVA